MKWQIGLVALLLAGCDALPRQQVTTAPSVPPPSPTLTRDQGARAAAPGRVERFRGDFDGGIMTVTITPMAGGMMRFAHATNTRFCPFNGSVVVRSDAREVRVGLPFRFLRESYGWRMVMDESMGNVCGMNGELRPV